VALGTDEVIGTVTVQEPLGGTVAPARVTELAVVIGVGANVQLVLAAPAIVTLVGNVSVKETLVKGMERSLLFRVIVRSALSPLRIVLGLIVLFRLGLFIALTWRVALAGWAFL